MGCAGAAGAGGTAGGWVVEWSPGRVLPWTLAAGPDSLGLVTATAVTHC